MACSCMIDGNHLRTAQRSFDLNIHVVVKSMWVRNVMVMMVIDGNEEMSKSIGQDRQSNAPFYTAIIIHTFITEHKIHDILGPAFHGKLVRLNSQIKVQKGIFLRWEKMSLSVGK